MPRSAASLPASRPAAKSTSEPAPGGSAANSPAGTREAASGATNPTPWAFIAAAFAQEISLDSPTSKNLRGPAICCNAVIAPVTWATSPAPPS